MQISSQKRTSRRAKRPNNRIVASFIYLVIALVFFGVGYVASWQNPPEDGINESRQWAGSRGHGRFGTESGLRRLLTKLPQVPSKILIGNERPSLAIDLDFEAMQALHAKRDEAIKRGRLIQDDSDFVRGRIRVDGRSIRAKFRLKGDGIDHLTDDRWSFRIEVSGDDHLFGMRRLSVQAPNTRGYQSESLYLDSLRKYGLITLRYFFADVQVNGSSLGIMAVEEHFSKELLEANGRREGVILRFDESLLWSDRRLWDGPFHDYKNAMVDAFRSGRIAESETLTEQYEFAVSQIRNFVAGRLSASEVFDLDQWANFVAVSELWGAAHSLRWHNLRFYLNPISLKLEPIPFDASLRGGRPSLERVVTTEPFVNALLAESEFRASYLRSLQRVVADTLDGNLVADLAAFQSQILESIDDEFWFLDEYPLDNLILRAEVISTLSDVELVRPAYVESIYPVLMHASLIEEGGSTYVELSNAIQRPVIVDSISAIAEGGEVKSVAIENSDEPFPIILPARSLGANRQYTRLALDSNVVDVNDQIRIGVRTDDSAMKDVQVARRYVSDTIREGIPSPNAAAFAKRFSFLRIDERAGRISFKPGTWKLDESLIIPENLDLIIPPGTKVSFGQNTQIISFGAVFIGGNWDSAEPVILDAREDHWAGIVVLDSDRESTIENSTIRNTNGFSNGTWGITGGVNFYKSDVNIKNVEFIGNTAEDALNIVSSHFSIVDTTFENTTSDAFDADFSSGRLLNCSFSSIGESGSGDAVDVSGTSIDIEDSTFTNITDKAISIGEQSVASVRNVVIVRVGTAVASKDGSITNIYESTFSSANVAALFVYTKKPEFGGSTVEAHNVTFNGNRFDTKVQTGSRASVNGESITSEPIDVDLLYETVMHKGAR